MAPGPFLPFGFGSMDGLTSGIVQTVATLMLLWFVNVALTGWLARRKGRDDGVWAVLALFLGPVALLAILSRAKQAPPPESEVERLEAATAGQLRLRSDTQLELDVAGQPAWLPGELLARIKGRPAFRLARSAAWQWSDGRPMNEEERKELLRELPRIGKRSGWILSLNRDDLA